MFIKKFAIALVALYSVIMSVSSANAQMQDALDSCPQTVGSAQTSNQQLFTFTSVAIERGDTLGYIAEKYDCPIGDLIHYGKLASLSKGMRFDMNSLEVGFQLPTCYDEYKNRITNPCDVVRIYYREN